MLIHISGYQIEAWTKWLISCKWHFEMFFFVSGPHNSNNDKKHYLNRWWPFSAKPNDTTRPQMMAWCHHMNQCWPSEAIHKNMDELFTLIGLKEPISSCQSTTKQCAWFIGLGGFWYHKEFGFLIDTCTNGLNMHIVLHFFCCTISGFSLILIQLWHIHNLLYLSATKA